MADELGPRGVENDRQPFGPSGHRGEPLGQRSEIAGDEAEQALTDDVQPGHRAPCRLAQVGRGEALRRKLAEEEVPVDLLVAVEAVVPEGLELGGPAIEEGETLGPADDRQVRPAIVVGVKAGAGRVNRVQGEIGGNERVDSLGEVGHCESPGLDQTPRQDCRSNAVGRRWSSAEDSGSPQDDRAARSRRSPPSTISPCLNPSIRSP